MPSTTGMRRGFNLRPGERIGRAEIAACDMGHETKKKYQTYEYPCKIQFKAKDAEKVKASWLRNIGTKSRIIHSEYGSPYECWFEEPSGLRKGQNDTVVMTVKAVANRRRDIPTLRDIAQKQKPPEPPDEIDALKRQCRVVRSHWATSRCGTCRDKILPGQMIAKKEIGKGADTSRGWSHVHCLALAMGVGKKKMRTTSTKKRGRPKKVEEAKARAVSQQRSTKARIPKTEEKPEVDGKVFRGRKRKAAGEPVSKRGRKRKAIEGVTRPQQTDDKKSDRVANAATGGDRASSDTGQTIGIGADQDSRKRQKKSA